MKATLIVCTRNRASRLGTFLSYLDAVDFSDAELIFVNNGSEDDTDMVLRQWTQGKPWAHILFEPQKGLGTARNTGWKQATGEIIVFTDDDCYAAPDYIQQHIRLYEASSALGWISGRILLHDPLDAKITIQENTHTVAYPASRFLQAGSVHGANISFRKTALERIGGFDPLMGVGSLFPCEDIDAAARACFQGFEGLYSPKPVVQHHHRRQTPQEVNALECLYSLGRGSYYGKCLTTPGMRKLYLRGIAGKWRHQPLHEVCSEIKAMWNWWRITRSRANLPPPQAI